MLRLCQFQWEIFLLNNSWFTLYWEFSERCKVVYSDSKPQKKLRRELKIINQKPLSIYDLQIYYLYLENSVRNNERAIFSLSRIIHCGGSHPNMKCSK